MKDFKIWWGVVTSVALLVITSVLGYFTNADTGNPKGFYQTKLAPILNSQVSVIVVLVIVLIIITINECLKISLKDEVYSLKDEVKDCRSVIANKSLDIIANLKDIQKLHKQESLRTFVERYTLGNPFVLAVQIYKYSFRHSLINTVYRVNYVDGYVRDEEEVNAITQMYYRVSRKISKQFTIAYMELIKNDNSAKLKSFVDTQLLKLNTKNIRDISEEDCVTYALLTYLVQVLAEEGEEIVSTITDPVKEALLNSKKRTGILRGIINDDFYKFKYSGEDDNKKDRLYVTFCKSINQVDYIFLITFTPEVNTNNQDEELFIRESVDKFLESSNKFDSMI